MVVIYDGTAVFYPYSLEPCASQLPIFSSSKMANNSTDNQEKSKHTPPSTADDTDSVLFDNEENLPFMLDKDNAFEYVSMDQSRTFIDRDRWPDKQSIHNSFFACLASLVFVFVVSLLYFLDGPSYLRVPLALLFLLIMPGYYFVDLLNIRPILVRVAVSVAVSIAICTIIGTIFLYAGAWNITAIFLTLVYISGVGIIIRMGILLNLLYGKE